MLSNEGKPGAYQRRTAGGASTLGKDGADPSGLGFNADLDDEILRSRIPERYRDTVRTYFNLLPELFSK